MKKLALLAIVALSLHSDPCSTSASLANFYGKKFTAATKTCNEFGCDSFEMKEVYNYGKNFYEYFAESIEQCNFANTPEKRKEYDRLLEKVKKTVLTWKQ